MALISATRLKNLKLRVRAECARRNESGSVASYSGVAYDYTLAPALGIIAKSEHRDKLVIPLNAINSAQFPLITGGVVISEAALSTMESFLTVVEKRSFTDYSASDCSGGCTGLCYSCTSCTGCTGCGTACSNNCDGACEGTCTDACEGCNLCTSSCGYAGCTASCYLSCYGECDGNCGTGCSYCSGGCAGISF